MKQTKKGFTLVELLVVIAILAILTTVSVVGYTTFIEKANRSVDEQAVAQINIALMAADIPEGSITNIAQVQELLDECNLQIKDYTPLSKDTFFFYDTALNRVIYTGNKDYNVLYPQDLADKTHKENWFSLNGEICTVTIDESANGWLQVDGNTFTATITTAEQLYTLSENFHNYGGAGKKVIININNDLNMMGAALSFSTDNEDIVTLQGVDEQGAPKQVIISNVANTTAAQTSKENSDGVLRNYSCGLFGKLVNDDITISNITLFNAQIGDSTIGQVGAFVGSLSASKLTMTNCHVVNSTITGKNKVGGMIGFINHNISTNYTFIISGCTVENTVIETSEGESGTAFGTVQLDPNSEAFAKSGLNSVTVENSKVVYTGNSTSTEWVEDQEIISAGTMKIYEGEEAAAVRYTFSMEIENIEFFVEKADTPGKYRPFASDARYFIQWYTKTADEKIEAVVQFVK